MSRDQRIAAIKQLETELGTPVLCYVTSTRRNAEAAMSMDAVRWVYDHLRLLDHADLKRLTLVVHSNGGEPATSWRLMNLLREFAQEVAVVVPHHAYSAATLLALGADEIIMHPMASLGPTDPSIVGPYNPTDPNNNPLPVSVEDVLSYIALVKEDVRINHEDELIQAFLGLVNKVHPLALGSVKRSHSQARLLAKKLMQLRKARPDDHKIGEIVDNLTSKLYYHGHPINRDEARGLGLPVRADPPENLEVAMWNLYTQYETDMKLAQEFNSAAELLASGFAPPPTAPQLAVADVQLPMVIVESERRCDVFRSSVKLVGTKDAGGGVSGIKVSLQRSEWISE
jgi:hypothetical protein